MSDGAPPWVVEAVGLTRVFPDAVAVSFRAAPALRPNEVIGISSWSATRGSTDGPARDDTTRRPRSDPVVASAAGRR